MVYMGFVSNSNDAPLRRAASLALMLLLEDKILHTTKHRHTEEKEAQNCPLQSVAEPGTGLIQ